MARAVLEPAIVLMTTDDAARRAILDEKLSPSNKKGQLDQPPVDIPGLDHLLGDMRTGRFIVVETMRGQQVFRVGPPVPVVTDLAPPEDLRRARETLRAIEIQGEERAHADLKGV